MAQRLRRKPVRGTRCTATNGNYNMTLYKVGTDGHLLWGIHTNVGEFSDGAMAATSDGGVVIALKMRHSSRSTYKSDIVCQLVDADGVETSVKWDAPDYETYGGVYQLCWQRSVRTEKWSGRSVSM